MKYTIDITDVITHSVFRTQPKFQPFIGIQAPSRRRISAAMSAERGMYAYPPLLFEKKAHSDTSAARAEHASVERLTEFYGNTPSRISSAAGRISNRDNPAMTLPD